MTAPAVGGSGGNDYPPPGAELAERPKRLARPGRTWCELCRTWHRLHDTTVCIPLPEKDQV